MPSTPDAATPRTFGYNVKVGYGAPASLLFHQFPIKIRKCRHGTMMFLETDKYIGGSLDQYGEYCESEARVFQQMIRPGDVVIDAGANQGAHTVLFSKLVGPEGRVHAFEPQGRIFQILCSNLALNGIENTTALRSCVSDTSGICRIPVMDYARFNNFGGVGVGSDFWRQEDVPAVTLDSLNLERCDFIKIDVEGMEPQAVVGAAATIERCQPVLWVEDDREEQSADLKAALRRHSYRLYSAASPYFDADNFYGDRVNMFGDECARSLLCLPRRLNDVELSGFAEA